MSETEGTKQDKVEVWLRENAPEHGALNAWRLMKVLYDPPEPMVDWMYGNPGGIQFCWSYSSYYMELDVEGDGKVHWFARNKHTGQYWGSEDGEEKLYFVRLLGLGEWFRMLKESYEQQQG